MLAALEDIHVTLERWNQSLCRSIAVGGFISCCPIAHKWKAPYRMAVLRETLMWRMEDLARQSVLPADNGHILGARILLRSAIETLALLIYTNQKMKAVLAGTFSFFALDEVTKQLLLGSKNGVTEQQAVNILTVLGHAEKDHEGLVEMHQHLSENAHPNYDGVTLGYSSTNPREHETTFHNNWLRYFGKEQEPGVAFVLAVFEHEYNNVWTELFSQLEEWLRVHDAELEAQRAGS